MNRACLYAIVFGAIALGACGDLAMDPLVGTWTYSGQVPDVVTLSLTFRADDTFTFRETVAPSSEPVGYVSGGCVTTDTYMGRYVETVAGGVNTLTWSFGSGTANAVSGCNDASNDSVGMPMTGEVVASYNAQGLIPPTSFSYVATETSLVITSIGLGQSPGTTFARSH